MIGAIIGDVVGSRFEFHNIKTKKFEPLTTDSEFTDDTVLTVAIMDWSLNAKDRKDPVEAAKYLQKWARKYPYAGYGGSFSCWMYAENPEPYNSCGNGSAMRISAVGWLFEDKEEMLETCRAITGITHNHPEGMKGAEVIATMIYMARHGASREELREYALSMYPEIDTLDYEELRRTYVHAAEICQTTVPQAIYCFLISKDFEDCLRTTISIGGDCDTTAAISCAVAEAFYDEIPAQLVAGVKKRLTNEMLGILAQAENAYLNQ